MHDKSPEGSLRRRLLWKLALTTMPLGFHRSWAADPAGATFDAKRYWRGPVWPQMKYLVSRGLAESGYDALAMRLRDDLTTLIARTGFHECFSPVDGAGSGGSDFTWTAAIWLHWASPTARQER